MWGLPRTFTCTYCKHSLTSVSNHYICSWNSSIKHGNPRKLTQSTMLQLLVSSFEGGTHCGHDLWLLSWTLHTHTGHLLCGIITINHVCSSSKYPRTVAGSSIWSPRSREEAAGTPWGSYNQTFSSQQTCRFINTVPSWGITWSPDTPAASSLHLTSCSAA